jgi:hypothetical protein
MRGEEEKIREIKFGNYRRSKIVPQRLMAQGASLRQYTDTKIIQNGCEHFAAFCLFMRTSPKDCALLGGNGNTLKLEMTTKIKDKQTSIATVRDLLRTFAIFPAPLLSHC